MAHHLGGLDRGRAEATAAHGLVDGDRGASAQPWASGDQAVPARPVVAAAIVIVVALAAAYAMVGGASFPERKAGEPAAAPMRRTFTVAAAPVSARVMMSGLIAPGQTVPIIAPFDGVVREKRVQLGDRVSPGDVLLVMDAGEAETRVREAQSALLKAAMAVEVLDRWETGPDVTRARRALEAAEAELAVLERRVAETRTLLDRGIVSRNEFDGLARQRDTQRLTVAGARQDLAAVRDRGSADNRKLSDLDLANARARLADLERQLAGAAVRASAGGIVTRPPSSLSSAGEGPVAIEPGARLARGQSLFALADTATLVVVGKVDEIDVGRIRVGQPAEITSDAFPGPSIIGRVVNVSAEAAAQGGSKAPAFEVRASFAGGADGQGSRIRIGMSARLAVEVAADARALIVPVEAVRGAPAHPKVRVLDRQTGDERDLAVTLGSTSEAGIAILSGLAAGDEVVLP